MTHWHASPEARQLERVLILDLGAAPQDLPSPMEEDAVPANAFDSMEGDPLDGIRNLGQQPLLQRKPDSLGQGSMVLR